MLWQWVNTDLQVFILDIDGTLMPSADIDDQCFWRAVFECFGKRDSLPDLHSFKHVTDSGVLKQWCARELGRPARSAEITWIRQRFLQLIDNAASNHPQHFIPLPGVEDWLEAVGNHLNVCAAIATGGWGHSARLKLQRSGLHRFDLPLASSDDAVARTDIMQVAVTKAMKHRSVAAADITYVGDGAWDLRASQKLGWRFIGIANGAKATRLRKAGATNIRADFRKSGFDRGPG